MQLFLDDPRTDVNAQEHQGRTALFFAAKTRQRAVVEALLGHPTIDVAITDHTGKNAVTYANELGHLDMAALIEEYAKKGQYQ
jgi:ankyrin repeat protein